MQNNKNIRNLLSPELIVCKILRIGRRIPPSVFVFMYVVENTSNRTKNTPLCCVHVCD